MKNIGVIGASGRVGKLLLGAGCVPLKCDIRNLRSVEKAVISVKPDIIVNLASKSSPEWCEKKENFREMFDVNVRGVHSLGEVIRRHDVPAVTLSTDHVFPGKFYFNFKMKRWLKSGPYSEDYVRLFPVNQYGMSKFAAESMAIMYDNMKIVRTSYLFDKERLYPLADSYPTFIYRSFMHINHFVESLLYYLENFNDMPKMLHISGSKTVSWADFMEALSLSNLKHKKEVEGFCPRPHKAGLVTTLSAKLGLPQYNYYDGLKLL